MVYVDETQVYQPIEGFGAATTDSAMYLLNEVAQPAQLHSGHERLVHIKATPVLTTCGIGLSFIRNPMGASDIARSVYSFDDNNGVADPTLANFSIAHDQADIIPLIQQAKHSTRNSRSWQIPGVLRAG